MTDAIAGADANIIAGYAAAVNHAATDVEVVGATARRAAFGQATASAKTRIYAWLITATVTKRVAIATVTAPATRATKMN